MAGMEIPHERRPAVASAVGLAELFAGEDLQPVFAGESEADQTRGVGGWDADAEFHHHFIHAGYFLVGWVGGRDTGRFLHRIGRACVGKKGKVAGDLAELALRGEERGKLFDLAE